MMDYLSINTPYRFELLLSRDYAEALDQLVTKKATAVFLGSYLYVKARDRYRIVPILKPLNENGEPSSRSVLIARPQAKISGMRDLRGKRLALPSSESFSANWLVGHELPLNGLVPGDLSEIRYFPHHQSVIYQVLAGRFDAGVTREYLVKDLLENQVRAVRYSDPIPSSPLVVFADCDTAVVGALTRALLAVNAKEERRITVTRDWDGEFVHGFVAAQDSDYDAVRRISRTR
jgi:phosphonate transport system substrate-binding protein